MLDDGSRLLTGSTDKTIKIWNPNAERWAPENQLEVGGAVQHIELKDDALVLSCDAILDTISPSDAVGLVQLINTVNNSRIEVKVGYSLL